MDGRGGIGGDRKGEAKGNDTGKSIKQMIHDI
jgi:hypothetical protein